MNKMDRRLFGGRLKTSGCFRVGYEAHRERVARHVPCTGSPFEKYIVHFLFRIESYSKPYNVYWLVQSARVSYRTVVVVWLKYTNQ